MSGCLVNKKIAESLQQFSEPVKFILAVSGGPDSQCLLKAFPYVSKKLGHSCVAVGVNHGLRAEADAELDLSAQLAEQVGVEFRRVKLNLDGGSNLQSRARDARYAALRIVASEISARFIVTAHHFDDRAETVLIRLLRGDGVGSLAVMPPISGQVYRPMLKISRHEIMSYLGYWGIKYATDPSNSDTHYLRAKIRHEILPALKAINPSICDRLNSISDELIGK